MKTPKLVGPETSPARFYICSMHANSRTGRFHDFCHAFVSDSDNIRSILRRILPMLTGFVIGVTTLGAAADEGSDLEAATREAVHLCVKAAASSLESCGNLTGRTPEASLARRAIIRYTQARGRLIYTCGRAGRADCMHLIEWHTQAGMNAAFEGLDRYSLSK